MRYSCAYSVVILIELAALLRHASLQGAPYRERCPRPHLKNGWVKIRSRGRIARFNCAREFQLLGEKFATCLGGEWDNPTPLCVRPGCEPLELSNGQMMAMYRGAVVTFFCNPGYRLEGIAKLYCDGKTWNGTAPQCTALSKEPAVWCDFENEDLCGWTQDPHHHFNWTRLNHNTPSGSVGTGPSYDHTLGKGKDGYYLYIETSGPRKQNDTARLYSPVYGMEVVAAQPSCFIFWYHMYGATVGSLAVYIKPDNTELTDDLETGFFQSGNKGDVWLNGIVNIPPIGVPFQIIIEGVRGPGYVGDTAIDDVRLANGSDCEQPTTVVPLVTAQPTHELSTKGAVTTASTRPSRTFPTPPPLPPLEPHPLESSTIRSQTSKDVFKPIPIPPDPTPLILNLPTRTTPSTVLKPTANTSTTILRNLTVVPTSTTKVQRPIIPATASTARNTTLASVTTRPTINTTTTRTTTNATTTTPTTKATTATTKTATTRTTKATTTRPTTNTTTTRTTTKATTTKPTTKTATTKTTTTMPTIKTTTTTTTRATTTTVKKPILVLTTAATKTTVKKPIVATTQKPRPTFRTTNVSTSRPRFTTATIMRPSTWRTNTMRSFLDNDIPGKDWNTVPREPLMQSEQSVPIPLIAGVTVLVATVAVVSIVVSIFIRQRRKSRSQQNLAEDSDVRFLTADEILDFTLARPREEDEDSN